MGGRNPKRAGAPSPATSTQQPASSTSSEQILGANPESIPVVSLVVLSSLSLAAAAWWRPGRIVFLGGVVFCLGAAIMDGREVAHQISEHQGAIAAVAAAVAPAVPGACPQLNS